MMVTWSNFYMFSAEEVESIELSESNIDSHPFRLTVCFKSGRNLSVNYGDMASRKAALVDISRQIDAEKRRDYEKIHNALFILKDAVNRIDKRQLRIWKQLKALLGVETEEE